MKFKSNDWIKIPAGTDIVEAFPLSIGKFTPNAKTKTTTIRKINWVATDTDGLETIIFDDCTMLSSPTLEKVVWPKVPIEKQKLMSRGSIWRVNSDILCPVGHAGIDSKRLTGEIITLSKGSTVTITGEPKIKYHINWNNEKCVPVVINKPDGIEPLKYEWISFRSFASLSLLVRGEEKTYWRLVDQYDNPVTTKRFKSLDALKGSVRYHTGLISVHDDVPEWMINTKNILQFDGWKAIHYSIEDVIISTIELDDWFIVEKLID